VRANAVENHPFRSDANKARQNCLRGDLSRTQNSAAGSVCQTIAVNARLTQRENGNPDYELRALARWLRNHLSTAPNVPISLVDLESRVGDLTVRQLSEILSAEKEGPSGVRLSALYWLISFFTMRSPLDAKGAPGYPVRAIR